MFWLLQLPVINHGSHADAYLGSPANRLKPVLVKPVIIILLPNIESKGTGIVGLRINH